MSLEQDEIEELDEEQKDQLYMARLTKDTQTNYSMLRKLGPVTRSNSIAVMGLMAPHGNVDNFFKTLEGIARFREWTVVEGGQIQVRESSDKEDTHGYVVVRPENDPTHEIVIRVWNGRTNSAVIMPLS